MTAATLIRTSRRRAGLTQAELARRMGTTQTAVARLERAQSNPSVVTLQRALNATGHRLELNAAPLRASLDDEQIKHQLRLTPSERARRHDAAYRNVAASVATARRVDG